MRAAMAATAIAIAPAALAGPSGNVLSNNLKDADNTTGQDSTRGSGVKTPHLQNGAVTAAKLAPASVGTSTLQDGAVTAAKINRTGLDADTLDGYHVDALAAAQHGHVLSDVLGSEALARRSPHVLVVSADGSGDFTDPAAALASITNASASNPYLVKVQPGRYPASSPVSVPAFVTLEGSGQAATVIVASGGDWWGGAFAVAGDGEIRRVTLEAVGSLVGLNVAGEGTARVSHVTVRATGTYGGTQAGPTVVVIGDPWSRPTTAFLEHVTVEANLTPPAGSAQAVYGVVTMSPAKAVLRDCDVTFAGATHATALQSGPGTEVEVWSSRLAAAGSYWAVAITASGVTRVRNCTLSAQTDNLGSYVILANGGSVIVSQSELAALGATPNKLAVSAGSDVSVAYSKVLGTVRSTGTMRCLGNYDDQLAPVTCQ
jgi:hypothetical protein